MPYRLTPAKEAALQERLKHVARLRGEGNTFQEIGDRIGLCGARAGQMFAQWVALFPLEASLMKLVKKEPQHIEPGQSFGCWLVIGPRRDRKHPRWRARCKCGVEKWVLQSSLLNGTSRDCGCENKKSFVSLAGQQFGAWTVSSEFRPGKNTRWLCRCKCGTEKWILRTELVSGRSQSCFCEGRTRQRLALIKPDAAAPKHNLFSVYQRGAQYRDLAFDLSKEEFFTLTQLPCAYCGRPPAQIAKAKSLLGESFIYNGIDRVDPGLGYILSNCLPCCGVCNRAKGCMSYEDFHSLIERIYTHRHHSDVSVTSEAVN